MAGGCKGPVLDLLLDQRQRAAKEKSDGCDGQCSAVMVAQKGKFSWTDGGRELA